MRDPTCHQALQRKKEGGLLDRVQWDGLAALFTMRGLTLILALLTFGLILLGGVVHSTGSSLACPDWPLCYGQIFPEMTGGIAIEHSHRLLASTIGFLTILLVVLSGRRRREDPKSWKLSWLALGLVIFQGGLGGITVLYRLPTLVSTAHLALSIIFFTTLLWIALRSWTGLAGAEPTTCSCPHHGWVKLTAILLYVQIVLGGLVRHTGAALACPDIPLCHGGELGWIGTTPISQLHMLHRFLGILVGLFVITTAFFVRRESERKESIDFLALNAVLLVFFQIGLGFLSVWSRLQLPVVTAHLAGATLLWTTLVALCFFQRASARKP